MCSPEKFLFLQSFSPANSFVAEQQVRCQMPILAFHIYGLILASYWTGSLFSLGIVMMTKKLLNLVMDTIALG